MGWLKKWKTIPVCGKKAREVVQKVKNAPYEKTDVLGGIVHHVIPNFRIGADVIQKDVAFIEKLGVRIETGREITDVAALKAEGFDAVVLALGASALSHIQVEGIAVRNAIEFLEEFNRTNV